MNNELVDDEIPDSPLLDFSKMKKPKKKFQQLRRQKQEKGKFIKYTKGQFVYADPSGVQSFLSQVRSKKRDEPVIVFSFIYFSILLQEGFKDIQYTIDRKNFFVKPHFKQIGSILNEIPIVLENLVIKIPIHLGNEINIKLVEILQTINEPIVNCQSDIKKFSLSVEEICCEGEMLIIADLITKLKVCELSLSFGKMYVKDVKEFLKGLVEFNNKFLQKVSFIDKSNPNESVELDELNELLEENKKIKRTSEKKKEIIYEDIDVDDQFKKDLIHNFVFSFSNDTSIELPIDEYPFFKACNDILFEITYPIKENDEEFKKICSLFTKLKPRTSFQESVMYFLKIKLYYTMKRYKEASELIKKEKILKQSKCFSKVTLSWIFSVISEMCYHLGEKRVDDIYKYSIECVKVRVELNHAQDILSCCLNTIRYLSHFKRFDLVAEFNVFKLKYSIIIHDVSYLVESVVDIIKFLEDKNSKPDLKKQIMKDFLIIYNKEKNFIDLIMKKNEKYRTFIEKCK